MTTTRVLRRSARSAQTVYGLLAITLLLTCLTSTAFAQSDAYYIGYFGNANLPGFPDSRVEIVNTGSTGGYSRFDGKQPVGDLCANIYVFKADQQMVECCSCFTTPNGHIQLSTNLDLTNNALQNSAVVPPPVAGVIKIVSSTTVSGITGAPRGANFCNLASGGGETFPNLAVAATSYAPSGSLRTWNTHTRLTVGGASPLYTESEIPLRPADLSWDGSELSKLQAQCYFLWNTGSGKGRCTCGATPN